MFIVTRHSLDNYLSADLRLSSRAYSLQVYLSCDSHTRISFYSMSGIIRTSRGRVLSPRLAKRPRTLHSSADTHAPSAAIDADTTTVLASAHSFQSPSHISTLSETCPIVCHSEDSVAPSIGKLECNLAANVSLTVSRRLLHPSARWYTNDRTVSSIFSQQATSIHANIFCPYYIGCDYSGFHAP